MKFALAFYGTRGDVEPGVAVARELLRRGHDVRLAVSPDLVGFAESAGIAAVAYGPDARMWQDLHRAFLTCLFRKPWRLRDLRRLWRKDRELLAQCWEQTSATLRSSAEGADLVFTSVIGEEPAANVAEYYGIPLATLHAFPLRPNGQLAAIPAPLARSAMKLSEALGRPLTKKLEDTQRRELGLPSRRIGEAEALEIQAYDEVCFPALAAEWAAFGGRRPFVGTLTLELTTDADDEVASWIAAGTPPIFFGFGSTPAKSPAETITMIGAACAQLGERALVCAGGTDFSEAPDAEHVKVVGEMNYAAAFPACRAVVHHGGTGTTAAGLRAGVPTLILSTWGDQTIWGAVVKRLKVGTTRRFSSTTQSSLVADLRRILDLQYVARAREIATRMTKADQSIAATADLVESFAARKVKGQNPR
ncbi:glycosyltransferase [Mycobacterium celatum]|uniref:Glycosyl transferase family 1 n=1 Tax=Mycobacterium celatum TaxID=28045 RepID=A0A1X1RQK5_MYCCE|nr:glycosyltransferase [Mycobacterium celatum]ORV12515.1 glycosyl transferase family 1 [Mycobacterium celatum]PIB74608.1 glycosyltransferase [Mycobacterium celatum]